MRIAAAGRYRRIDMRMHGDAKYRKLSPCPPCGQALWWALLAGRQTGIIPGLCSIGEAAFAEQLRWPLEAFREAFGEVFREGMAEADWEAHLVWVPNAVKYNPPASPNVILSWRDTWDELPECDLKTRAYGHLRAYVQTLSKPYQEAFFQAISDPGKPFDMASRKAFDNPSPKPSDNPSRKPSGNQDQDQEQDLNTPPTPETGGGTEPDSASPEQSNPEASDVESHIVRPEPFSELLAEWQAAKLPGHDKVSENPHRRGQFEQRQADDRWRVNWREAVRRLGRSAKARGEDPAFPRGIWLTEFLKHPDFVQRILEGEFDDHRSKPPPTASPPKIFRAADNPMVNAQNAPPMAFAKRSST